MIPETMERAVGIAKQSLQPPYKPKEHYTIKLARYIVLSRRQGKRLKPEQLEDFDRLVREHLGEILTNTNLWNDRWLTSLMDTYAENGHGIAIACSCIRMMEQWRWQKDPEGGLLRCAPTADNHLNIFDRLERELPAHVWALFKSFWKQLADNPKSLVGRHRLWCFRDITANLHDRDAWKPDTQHASIAQHTTINPCLQPHERPSSPE